MTFRELGLREELLRALEESDHQQPTPIQAQGIPQALAGRDLICCAQTGTGKTAAFALPILHRLAEGKRATIRALILVPTRELALQVGKSLEQYGAHLDLLTATVYGGVPIQPQERLLRQGVDILVATPGRLKDHIWRGNLDFRHTTFLVLDEADRMLDMGFIKAVREIVELLPEERQSMLFSATLDEEIRRFSRGILRNPLRIEVSPPASTLEEVDQFLVSASRQQKRSVLEGLIRKEHMQRAIVFARTKSGASRLAVQLRERGHNASAIHSDRSQAERVRALEGFREGRIQILVATDIAARGIDVDDVTHVVNYDLPHTAKDYVHRIGRTARAGRRGMAISLVTPEDAGGVASIERLIARKLAWMGEPPSAGTETSRRSRSSTESTDQGDAQDRSAAGRLARDRSRRATPSSRLGDRRHPSPSSQSRDRRSSTPSRPRDRDRSDETSLPGSDHQRRDGSPSQGDDRRRGGAPSPQSGNRRGRAPSPQGGERRRRDGSPSQGGEGRRRPSSAPETPAAERRSPRTPARRQGSGRRSSLLLEQHRQRRMEAASVNTGESERGIVKKVVRGLKARLFS
jgi:ATP-dependent RNA helicase RhlE